jgi:hypothetical protein
VGGGHQCPEAVELAGGSFRRGRGGASAHQRIEVLALGGEREGRGRLWRRWCGGHGGEVGRLEVGEAPNRRAPPVGAREGGEGRAGRREVSRKTSWAGRRLVSGEKEKEGE